MKKIVLIFLAALAFGFAVFLYVRYDSRLEVAESTVVEPEINISIKRAPFKAVVRDDPATRARGLSGRESLENSEAMLFVFPNPGMWGIWMKGMKFSIDILWLDVDRKVVHIEKNISPDTYPNIFFPKSESLYVIELGSGVANKVGVFVGDEIMFAQPVPVGK